MSMIEIKEVMAKTLLSRSMIYKLVKSNIIPHYQFGTSLRFDDKEIDNWIKANYKT